MNHFSKLLNCLDDNRYFIDSMLDLSTKNIICGTIASTAINLCFQLTREMLFSGSNDGTLRIWDVSGMTDETAFASQHSKKKSKARDLQKTTDEKLICATSNLSKNKTSNKITVEDDY